MVNKDNINDDEEINDDGLELTDNNDDDDEIDTENDDQDDESKEKSKHKIKDKHKLPYDSIFKGKKIEAVDELPNIPKQESFEFDVSSTYYEENKNPEEYKRLKDLREEIYIIVIEKLKLNIKAPRRKPSRSDFNRYMDILIKNLEMQKYSHAEIFIEFAYYFSDNTVNMFKLLEKKWGGKIAKELADRSKIKLNDIDFI